MEWVDKIRRNLFSSYELYYGHSLDKTDKDILKLLICNNNVKTKIYYHRKIRMTKRVK